MGRLGHGLSNTYYTIANGEYSYYTLQSIAPQTGELTLPVVKVEPTKDKPVPYDTSDDKVSTLMDEITVAGNTAELQQSLGASITLGEEDLAGEKELLDAVVRDKDTKALKSPNTAFAATAFLRTYGQNLGLDVASARAALTNKLMEIANCGDARYELKAIELLGKHNDIALFTTRSEVTIDYKNPEDLERAIKERVKRLLNADVIDVTPVGVDLDEELGVFAEKEKPSKGGGETALTEQATEVKPVVPTPEEETNDIL